MPYSAYENFSLMEIIIAPDFTLIASTFYICMHHSNSFSVFTVYFNVILNILLLFSGGPLGELVQWSDIITSLYVLGHDLTITSEVEQLAT